MPYICEHIWDILQTIIGIIALIFAYFAWKQYKKDKRIEYWKMDYQLAKETYDYYCTDPDIKKLIDIKHKEAEDIPQIKEKLQDNMINATYKLQSELISYIHPEFIIPDLSDSKD